MVESVAGSSGSARPLTGWRTRNAYDAFVAAGHLDSTLIVSPGAGHFSGTVLGMYPNGQLSTHWPLL